MKSIILLFCLAAAITKAEAQTGQICFMRATGTQGSLVNDRVFIDDSLVCKLKNNSYSLHSVTIGEHTVSVNSAGLGGGKKSPAVSITVLDGKINYVDISVAKRVIIQEVTEKTGSQKIRTLTANTNCRSN